MVNWDSFDKIWASTSPLTPYEFSDPNYSQGWNFVGSTPPARQMWDSIQKTNDEKFKYLRDNFGTPNIVTQASQMTDTDKVYVYLGSEAGWNNGHWYYYDEGTSSWADGGVYNSVAFVTDTTLSIAGQPADAKATGDALALKSDLAGATFTGNVGINADLSVTGDATIGTDLSVTGVSTLTGNVSAGADVTVVGDVSSANLTTGDATIGGDLSVTGTSTLAGNITTSGDISADNISATTNATVGGNLSVTGTSTLTGNINAGADIVAVGDISADNLTTTTNATIGGSLSVAGTSTLTGNVTASGNISAVGDITSANISTTNATIGGNATVTGDVSCANLTTSADATVGGDLTVTGDSTFADAIVNDLVVNNDLSVAGDSSHTNLSVSGTTALAGTSTAPTPSADDNSTKIATTEYVQTEIKPIEVNADIVNKRVTNIEKLLEGNLYDYQTDTDTKYTKTVPNGAMPYASLDSIGGKTLVMNQLIQNGNFADSTGWAGQQGTLSVADNVATVTCSANYGRLQSTSLPTIIASHKYLLMATIKKNISFNGRAFNYKLGTVVGSLLWNSNVNTWDTFGTIFTATANNTAGDYLYIADINTGYEVGATVDVKNVMLIDLTLLYGAGNEPSTVQEFQQQFPADYYAFNNGSLLSAGVTEVVSQGVNLFDKNAITDDSYLNTTTGSVDSAIGYCVTDYIPVYAGQTVYIPATFTARRWFYDVDKNPVTHLNNSNEQYYTPTTSGYIRVSISTTSVDINGVIVAYSTTRPTYVPYNGHTYPIPAEVQALEGYGWSAGSVYNYIDYERKVFVKNVGSVDLGTKTYTLSGAGNWQTAMTDEDIKQNTQNIVMPMYTRTPTPATSGEGLYWVSSKTFYVRDTSYATASDFKTAMSGVYLYYELATPIETDISAYLTDDNLIEVEANGTLTFPNSNGTDYQIPIPSSETFMVDLQEAI